MNIHSITPSRRRLATASAVAIAVFLGTVGVQPALALDAAPPTPLCPPVEQTVGTHLNERLYDPVAHPGPFLSSRISGWLPGGSSLFDAGWYSEYQAVPTTTGSYDFTIRLTSAAGTTAQAPCHVDVSEDPLDLASRMTVTRIGAPDRYDQAARLSQIVNPAGIDTVYIASGEVFADALSASAIAAQRGAPLLLAKSTSIPATTLAELVRLKPRHIAILGGTDTISSSVEASLKAFTAVVRRYAGADRFEASRNIIVGDAPASDTIYVASGNVFPDSLTAAPAGGVIKAPVLLVDGGAAGLSTAETDLLSARGITRAIIIGGPSTVSDDLEASLRAHVAQVKRIEGEDRYDASAAIARDTVPASASTRPDTVYFATGESYPDALAGAALAAKTGSPIYLVHSDCIPRDAARHILDIGAKKAVLLGGDASLSHAVMSLTVCSR